MPHEFAWPDTIASQPPPKCKPDFLSKFWENAHDVFQKQGIGDTGCRSSPCFTPAVTLPFAARSSATQPRVRGEIKNRASGVPLAPPTTVTLFAFTRQLSALARTAGWVPFCEASSKRQGDGQRFQKKAMKTTNFPNEATAPASVRQSSVSKTPACAARNANSELSTQTVLDFLKSALPHQYELAEVGGQWVWLDFPATSHRAAANTL